MSPAPARLSLDALTSLRFLAALAVAIYHVPSALPRASATDILLPGSLGVVFFFVLSGFILSHADQNQATLLPNFYIKRFARIYPLHLLTFVVWSLIAFRYWHIPIADKFDSGIANLLLLQALFSGTVYTLGYNAVSWSISVEAFFYLFFPVLRRAKAALLWLAGATIVGVGLSVDHPALKELYHVVPHFFYFDPCARTVEFVIGILAYKLFARVSRLPFATLWECAAIGAAFVAIANAQKLPDSLEFEILAFSFAAVIIVIGTQQGLVAKLLRFRPFVVLGEASFAFYLTHSMIFGLFEHSGLRLSGLPLLLLALTTVSAVSIALFYIVETPMRTYLTRRLTVKADRALVVSALPA